VAETELPGSPAAPVASSLVTVAESAVAAQTFEGWAALQFSVNVLLPRYIDQATHNLAETCRILSG